MLRADSKAKCNTFTACMALESQGGSSKPDLSHKPAHLWWLHTAGAAQALWLAGTVGNLVPCAEADFVVLDP